MSGGNVTVTAVGNFTYVPPKYSLGAQCGSEALCMTLIIFMGESILANEVLAKTKGHEMGFGAIALGYAFAFAMPIMGFGYISAVVNPAGLISAWVLGDISVSQFFALFACEIAGAFVGAVLVWLQYLPHFKTVPEPAPRSTEDELLRVRDYVGVTGLNFVGNKAWISRPSRTLLEDVPYYFNLQDKFHMPTNELIDKVLGIDGHKADHNEHVEKPETSDFTQAHSFLYRRSVQVADLQRRLKKLDEELHRQRQVEAHDVPHHTTDVEAPHDGPHDHPSRDGASHDDAPHDNGARDDNAPHDNGSRDAAHGQPHDKLHGSADEHANIQGSASAAAVPSPEARTSKPNRLKQALKRPSRLMSASNKRVRGAIAGARKGLRKVQRNIRRAEARDKISKAEYEAALLADQHAKLSIFATRPAIVAPVFNFLCEFMGTAVLILGANLLGARGGMVYATASGMYPTLDAFFVGWYIFLCVVGLGGPTGYAANPARDFGPRLAHWVLPIPNKGPSEWWYAPIPFFACLLGGLAGGGLFAAINSMNRSDVVDPATLVLYRVQPT